jgi:hypothetical protein
MLLPPTVPLRPPHHGQECATPDAIVGGRPTSRRGVRQPPRRSDFRGGRPRRQGRGPLNILCIKYAPALHTPRTEQHIPIARGLGMAAKAASRLTAPCAWTFFSPAQSAPRAGTSAPWAGTSTRYYANSSPASKETACAAPLCTPPPAARPRPWPGHCRPQYYECEWGRQLRAPTSLAPPVRQCGRSRL